MMKRDMSFISLHGYMTVVRYSSPHVVDKGTKLETIFDRIELIKTRMEILKRDAEIAFLKGRLMDPYLILMMNTKDTIQNINDNIKFIKSCNIGGEF